MAHTIISPTSPIGGYRLNATINSTRLTRASFLVDTGATVTLLREDVWERSNVTRKKLEPWSKSRLVGVDGTPLHAHGSALVALNLNGDLYQTDVVVVSAVTTKAILGLDFLQRYKASVDIGKRQLTFGSNG